MSNNAYNTQWVRSTKCSWGTAAFTIVELLAVITIVAILAGLLLVGLRHAKLGAQRTVCLNNLRQIDLGVRMYCDDSADVAPGNGATNGAVKMPPWIAYKEFMKNYVGLHGASSSGDKLFDCPADTFYYAWGRGRVLQSHYTQPIFDFSSYTFNGFNQMTLPANIKPVSGVKIKRWPGMAGVRLSAIKHPDRTVMVAEAAAFYPYSWHEPGPIPTGTNNRVLMFNNAMNAVGFVDGHVTYLGIYWPNHITNGGIQSCCADPPAQYGYQWSDD